MNLGANSFTYDAYGRRVGKTISVGGFAGFGGGGFLTNAKSACQLQGPFDTSIFGFGPGELQISRSGPIFMLSLTFGPSVPGGVGLSNFSTTTASTTLAGRKGC
jgi:hypothetical protein